MLCWEQEAEQAQAEASFSGKDKSPHVPRPLWILCRRLVDMQIYGLAGTANSLESQVHAFLAVQAIVHISAPQ